MQLFRYDRLLMLGVECGQAQYFIPILGMLLGNAISGVSVGLTTLLEELATGLLPFVRRSKVLSDRVLDAEMLALDRQSEHPLIYCLMCLPLMYGCPKANGLPTLPCILLRANQKPELTGPFDRWH